MSVNWISGFFNVVFVGSVTVDGFSVYWLIQAVAIFYIPPVWIFSVLLPPGFAMMNFQLFFIVWKCWVWAAKRHNVNHPSILVNLLSADKCNQEKQRFYAISWLVLNHVLLCMFDDE